MTSSLPDTPVLEKDEWDRHRDYHRSMLTPDGSENGQIYNAYIEESKTAPLFSVETARSFSTQNCGNMFPQYGLLAKLEQVYDPESTSDSDLEDSSDQIVQKPDDDRIFLNMNTPFSTFVCGSQGSGKSHTLSCVLEMALLESDLGKLPQPLTGIVFHYDKHAGLSKQLCEAAYLSSSGIPVTVLVTPSNYQPMKSAYENLPRLTHDQPKPRVLPLLLGQRDLNMTRMLKLMAVEAGNDSLYIQMIRKIVRDVAEESNADPDRAYTHFRRELAQQTFDTTQKKLLDMRLILLESFMEEREKNWKVRSSKPRQDLWSSKPGSLTIVDLSDGFIDEGEACTLFDMCLSLFLENKPNGGTIIALDEAHKVAYPVAHLIMYVADLEQFMSDAQPSTALTESLVSVIRLQRHLGARIVIATQEPTIASTLMDLCSMTIVHRFTSPSWLQALRGHLAGVSTPGDEGPQRNIQEMFKTIVNLEAGEALLFSPSAMLGSTNSSPDSNSIPKIQKLGLRYVKMRVRKRLTTDGGRSSSIDRIDKVSSVLPCCRAFRIENLVHSLSLAFPAVDLCLPSLNHHPEVPTTKNHGTPGPANDLIGGTPTIHYFDFASRGRGQVIRLLWEDAGIAYEDIRFSFDEWLEYKKTVALEKNPTSNVPIVELNGRVLTQSYAILRYFAGLLGKYDGETGEERYWVDAMCDIGSDWRTIFLRAYFSPNKEEAYPKHQQTDRNRFLKALETHLTTHELSLRGPYVIGETVTYADFVFYQIMHDEGLTKEGRKGLQEYPRLRKLVDAVEGRPGVKAFLESDRYLG
ncbi:MAG: hypothetical protein Q9222_006665 [Ikaeria aurantiellina]